MVLTASEVAKVAQLTNDELYAIALAWVNDLRTEYGEEPLTDLPQGLRYEPGVCVLSRAVTSALCDGSAQIPSQERYSSRRQDAGVTFGRDGRVQRRPIPNEVEQFMRRFDKNEYPHLVVPTAPVGVITT